MTAKVEILNKKSVEFLISKELKNIWNKFRKNAKNKKL